MRLTRPRAGKISQITIDTDIAMGTKKLTDLGAGSDRDHSVRLDQVIGVFLPLEGGTMTGDIQLGANNLKTTNLLLKQGATTAWYMRNVGDTGYISLWLNAIVVNDGLDAITSPVEIRTQNVDGAILEFLARTNGGARVNVARLVGAADPYFELTLPAVVKQAARPGALVDGHLVYNSTTKELEIYKTDHFQQFLHSVKKTVNYNDSSPVTIATMPAGSIVISVMVYVKVAFVGTTPTVDIGDADDTDGFLATQYIDEGTIGWYPSVGNRWGAYLYSSELGALFFPYATAKAITCTIGGTGLSAGVADVYIVYIALG